MVFEGLVIHKTPYKERDLIVKLLLRNGFAGSFYVYGGQGGGKHHKPMSFEIGNMMKIMIRDRKHNTELMVAAEFQKIWEPQNIRHNIQAFYLLCLYVEIIQKTAQNFELGKETFESSVYEGNFSVLSNAVFHLEDALMKSAFIPEQQFSLFMIKLLFHLGVMPDTDHCSYCSTDLLASAGASFRPEAGQFACLNCVPGDNEKFFLLRVKKGYQTRYQDYAEFVGATFAEGDKLLQYFCQQFNLRPVELKAYSLLFK